MLLVHDKIATATEKVSFNVGRCLQDASIKFDLLDKSEIPQFRAVDLAGYAAIVFLAEGSSKFIFAEDALEYVRNGGVLCFAFHDFNIDLMPEIGVHPADESGIEYLDARGALSPEPVLRETKLNLEPDLFLSSALRLNFSPDWKILLKYQSPDQVMLAQRKLGKGSIVFWNSSALGEKPFRGLFLFSLFRQFPIAAFSVFNVALMHIDDSPPPAYGIKEGPVYRDLGMNDYQFHLRVWQKHVFAMLDEFAFKATHFVCLRYDDNLEGPFPEEVDREPFFSDFVKEARKHGHDFSFHGYNHQSLTLGNSPAKPWKSYENMLLSNQAAFKIWNKYRFEQTLSYVPPNNVIDKQGKLALLKGFPTIRVICRIYQDSGIYGGASRQGYLIGVKNARLNDKILKNIFSMYASRSIKTGGSAAGYFAGDEFGSDSEVKELLNLPRISSGYKLDGYDRLLILNGIMAHGYASHFFHPDDVFDPARRESTWEKTKVAMRRIFHFLDQNSKHLRRMVTARFLREFRAYIFANTQISRDSGDNLVIEPDRRRFYYLFVNQPDSVPQLKNAGIVSEIEPGRLFLIEATGTANITLPAN